MNDTSKIEVLFVCMGNICRSPTAEGVFRALVDKKGYRTRIGVDSAGTHSYHTGNGPDERALATARDRGVDLGELRARQVDAADFDRFDYIIAMDADNVADIRVLVGDIDEKQTSLKLLMDFAQHRNETNVPDPYYGGDGGFDAVFEMIEDAAEGLLEEIVSTHGLATSD